MGWFKHSKRQARNFGDMVRFCFDWGGQWQKNQLDNVDGKVRRKIFGGQGIWGPYGHMIHREFNTLLCRWILRLNNWEIKSTWKRGKPYFFSCLSDNSLQWLLQNCSSLFRISMGTIKKKISSSKSLLGEDGACWKTCFHFEIFFHQHLMVQK